MKLRIYSLLFVFNNVSGATQRISYEKYLSPICDIRKLANSIYIDSMDNIRGLSQKYQTCHYICISERSSGNEGRVRPTKLHQNLIQTQKKLGRYGWNDAEFLKG